MLRIETRTKLKQDDVVKRATNFFLSHKMKQVATSPGCASFEGAGGSVSFSTSVKDNLTSIEFVTQEWEKQVRDFIELLPQKVVQK